MVVIFCANENDFLELMMPSLGSHLDPEGLVSLFALLNCNCANVNWLNLALLSVPRHLVEKHLADRRLSRRNVLPTQSISRQVDVSLIARRVGRNICRSVKCLSTK